MVLLFFDIYSLAHVLHYRFQLTMRIINLLLIYLIPPELIGADILN